jgi:hypothetical protein
LKRSGRNTSTGVVGQPFPNLKIGYVSVDGDTTGKSEIREWCGRDSRSPGCPNARHPGHPPFVARFTSLRAWATRQGRGPHPAFNELAAQLDDLFKTEGLFAGHAGEAWKMPCGLAHGGLEQLNRRVGENGEIGCHFEQEDVQRLLTSSTSVLVRIAIQFLGARDRQDACQAVSAKYVNLYPVPEER